MLGFTGNVGYFLAIALAVPLAGTALVALVIGCLPVVMAILGNRGADRIPPRASALPLLLLAAGLVVFNAAAFGAAQAAGANGPFFAGLGLTLLALALWAYYGLRIARR